MMQRPMIHRLLFIPLVVAAVLLAAACQPPTTVPTVDPAAAPLYWTRSADTIVFRADRQIGDPASPAFRAGIPDCTVYGDNRVVWINQLDSFATQVLYDQVADERILDFIEQMTVNGRLYTFQRPTPDPVVPPETRDPSVGLETLIMTLSGITHATDETAGWGLDYYEQAVAVCAAISTAPVLFAPLTGAWLQAIPDPALNAESSVTWDAATTGFSLAGAAGDPVWMPGAAAQVVWNYQRTLPPGFGFEQEDIVYRVHLFVPGITRSSPPAPTS